MPLERRYFSEPFASHLRAWCEQQERDEKAKADGTYRKPEPVRQSNPYADKKAAMVPPTAKQMDLIRKLGGSIPLNKLDASAIISELLSKK